MKHLFRSCGLTALALCSLAGAHAQTATILSGRMTFSLSPSLTSALDGAGFTASLPDYSASGFKVTGGSASSATETATLTTMSRVVFTRTKRKLQLEDIGLEASTAGAFLTAEVLEDGVDVGRYPVFQLVDVGPFSVESLTKRKKDVTVGGLEFTISPEFATEFVDALQLASFDTSEVLGSISLDVTLRE